jgi:photosystem II stability/assembly factor-like uncharacterized protein
MICDDSSAYYTTDGGATWKKSESNFKFTPFGGWNLNKPADIAASLTDCCMASDKEAWACSEQGVVFKSSDGGVTWKLYSDLGKNEPLLAIDIKPGSDGWSAGSFSRFYDTVPIKRMLGGMWSNEAVTTYGASDFVYDISCINGDDGWLVGKGGLILHVKGVRWPVVTPQWQPKQ